MAEPRVPEIDPFSSLPLEGVVDGAAVDPLDIRSGPPDCIKNHPALKGVDVPKTGKPERAGIMVTKTLVFAGEGSGLFAVAPFSGGPMFRALDKKTGATISEFKLPANQSGIPMTYMVDGKQYIVVAVGAPNTPAELVALTLP